MQVFSITPFQKGLLGLPHRKNNGNFEFEKIAKIYLCPLSLSTLLLGTSLLASLVTSVVAPFLPTYTTYPDRTRLTS